MDCQTTRVECVCYNRQNSSNATIYNYHHAPQSHVSHRGVAIGGAARRPRQGSEDKHHVWPFEGKFSGQTGRHVGATVARLDNTRGRGRGGATSTACTSAQGAWPFSFCSHIGLYDPVRGARARAVAGVCLCAESAVSAAASKFPGWAAASSTPGANDGPMARGAHTKPTPWATDSLTPLAPNQRGRF